MSVNEVEIKNARIESATLTKADHGLLTAWLHLDYGGSGQGFGGYGLYLPKSFTHSQDAKESFIGAAAGHFIWRVLEVADVEEWGKLPGRTIRVKASWTDVEAIGHILKDDWFDPKADFEALREGRLP